MSIEEQRQQVIDGIARGDPDGAGKICRGQAQRVF